MLSEEDQQRRIVAAHRRLLSMSRDACFDPLVPDSKPTAEQLRALKAAQDIPIRWILGGNQSGKCLISGTFIATPGGAVAIEDLKIGDLVYNETGKAIRVTGKQYQGRQKVFPIVEGKKVIATATGNHRWFTEDFETICTEELLGGGKHKIKRRQLNIPLGAINEPHAYALAALLGNGSVSEGRRNLVVSSEHGAVPEKMAKDLGAEVRKCEGDNYNWIIYHSETTGSLHKKVHCRHYDAWGKNFLSHQKVADLDVIRTWNRRSAFAFMAGLLDTDGSVYSSKSNPLVINWGMQAKSVMRAAQWILLSLWQYETTLKEDKREKYKNGSVWYLQVTRADVCTRILRDLDEFLIKPRNKFKPEYLEIGGRRVTNSIRYDRIRDADTWDIEVDNPTHLFMLANGLVTHNSQLGGRDLSWVKLNRHPYFTPPEEWIRDTKTFLVMGRTMQQVEEELWNKKLKPFFDPASYKEVRIGVILSKIKFHDGDTILFMSHHAPEQAREKAQSFMLNYVWLDEMPDSMPLIEELHRRLQSKRGLFLATFTPKLRNEQIRRYVDMEAKGQKKFKLKMFDNPIYADPEKTENLRAQLAGIPENYRKTIEEGDWYVGDLAVYDFQYNRHVEDLPEHYGFEWRHVVSVDPAASGKVGFTLWAEDPANGVWFCIKAKYLIGQAGSILVQLIEKEMKNMRIVRRIADPHEAWFIKEATLQRIMYMGVYKKNNRKKELIKNLQESVHKNRIKITSNCEKLVDEFTQCQWSETAKDKIIGAKRFHLLDSAQYFADNIPKFQQSDKELSFRQQIKASDARRKKKIKEKLRIKRSRRSAWGSSRRISQSLQF